MNNNPETDKDANRSPAVRVFYDGACPLCRREIAHYRRLRGADRLDWVDIARDDAALRDHGLRREQAMARMHVLDATGRWQTGVWAFVELWSYLPGYHWLARILLNTGTLPLLDRGYARFARWRLQGRRDLATSTDGTETHPGGACACDAEIPTQETGAGRPPQTTGERQCA